MGMLAQLMAGMEARLSARMDRLGADLGRKIYAVQGECAKWWEMWQVYGVRWRSAWLS